jgi:hypothetical protein
MNLSLFKADAALLRLNGLLASSRYAAGPASAMPHPFVLSELPGTL